MASNIRLLPRKVGHIISQTTPKRISFTAILHQQQRPSSAAAIALKASTKYPAAHKLIKPTSSTFIGGIGPLTERETAQVSQVLRAMEQRKKFRYASREKVWTGAKYAWKFVEATYLSFSLFLLYMATLDWATGGEVSKGGKGK